jgi:hypothetical protein
MKLPAEPLVVLLVYSMSRPDILQGTVTRTAIAKLGMFSDVKFGPVFPNPQKTPGSSTDSNKSTTAAGRYKHGFSA